MSNPTPVSFVQIEAARRRWQNAGHAVTRAVIDVHEVNPDDPDGEPCWRIDDTKLTLSTRDLVAQAPNGQQQLVRPGPLPIRIRPPAPPPANGANATLAEVFSRETPASVPDTNLKQLPLSQIRRDGGTQPRAALDDETLADYVEAMKSGAKFPPVIVFYDGSAYWLADGFHRVNAAITAALTEINARIIPGTQRDAVLYSVGANSDHGLRRTNADKRRAVERLLRDEEWSKWSDREIARMCSVGNSLVSSVRRELSVHGAQIDARRVMRNGTEYIMNTAPISQASQSEHDVFVGNLRHQLSVHDAQIDEGRSQASQSEHDTSIGNLRRQLSVNGAQIDEGQVMRDGTEYTMNTPSIAQAVQSEHIGHTPAGSAAPEMAPIWQLEMAVRDWASHAFPNLEQRLSTLESLKKDKDHAAAWHSLATSIRHPHRRSDLLQAINNVTDQTRNRLAAIPGQLPTDALAPTSDLQSAIMNLHFPHAIGPVTVHCADAREGVTAVTTPVHLIITSPPYNTGGAIEYHGHTDDLDPAAYDALLTEVWQHCAEVMAPGGRLCINVPFGMGRSPWVPVTPAIYRQLAAAGLTIEGQIVWDKGTSGNSTAWGSWGRPSNPVLRDTCEAIIIAAKPGESAMPRDILVQNGPAQLVSPWLREEGIFMQLTQDHWQVAPESASRIGHPAPFPVKLAENLLRLYGWPGCHLLDPFAGSGTTALAVVGLPGGDRCQVTLIEQSPVYCQLAATRLTQRLAQPASKGMAS